MADLRTLTRGVATVTSARFLGLIFTMLQVKLTLTYLGEDDYGRLSTVTLMISLFAGLSELGIGTVIVRRVAAEGRDLTSEVGVSLALTLMLMGPAVAMLMGVTVLLYQATPVIIFGMGVLAIGMVATMWATCFNPVAQVTHRFGYYAAADLVGRIVSLGVIVMIIHWDGRLRWFFLAQLMVPLGQFVAMSLLGRSAGPFRPIWDRARMVSLLREALPITYLLAIGVTYFTIDGILLSKLATFEQVGAYNFSYRTVGAATIVATSISNVLAARLSAVAAESPERFARAVSRALRFTGLVAAPFAAFITPIAPDIIRFLGTDAMVPLARTPMSLLAVAIAIGMLSGVLSTAVIACYRQGVLVRLNTVTLGINILLNVILIPRYQATGSAIALVITEALGFAVVLFVLAKRTEGSFPLRAFALLVVPILVCLGIGEILVDTQWVIRLAAMCVVYGAVVLTLRITTIDELRELTKRRVRADQNANA